MEANNPKSITNKLENMSIMDTLLSPFDLLSEESILHILQHLDAVSLYRTAFVSRFFQRLAKDVYLNLQEKLMDLSFSQIDLHKFRNAMSILRSLLYLFPNAYEAWKELGACWMDLNQPMSALPDLENGLKVCTNPAFKHMIKAHIYWVKGAVRLGLEEVNMAVTLDPKDARYLHFRGYLQSNVTKEEEDKEASQMREIEDYKKILTLDYKRMGIIYSNYGYSLYEIGQYDEAEEYFDKAIEMAPRHAQAYYNRAVLNAEMNNFEQAIIDCKTMLSLNPELYEPNAFMGWCYLRSSQVQKAFQCYHRAFHLNPADLHVIYSLVRLLFKQGYYEHFLDEIAIVIEEVTKKINAAQENMEKARADPYFNCLVPNYEKEKDNNSKLLGLAHRFRCEATVYVIGQEAVDDYEAAKLHLKEEDWESMRHILYDYDHSQIRKEARGLIKAVLCSRMKSVSDYKSLSNAAEQYFNLHKVLLNIEEMKLLSMVSIHKQIGVYDKNPKIETVKLLWSKVETDPRFIELFENKPWKIVKAVALFEGLQQPVNDLYDLLTKPDLYSMHP